MVCDKESPKPAQELGGNGSTAGLLPLTGHDVAPVTSQSTTPLPGHGAAPPHEPEHWAPQWPWRGGAPRQPQSVTSHDTAPPPQPERWAPAWCPAWTNSIPSLGEGSTVSRTDLAVNPSSTMDISEQDTSPCQFGHWKWRYFYRIKSET